MGFLECICTINVYSIYVLNMFKNAENITLPILSYSFCFLYFFLALCYLFMSWCNILLCSLKHTWSTWTNFIECNTFKKKKKKKKQLHLCICRSCAGTDIFVTYVCVDFFVIFHFPKVHVIHHQRLSQREFTLGQSAQHPLILCEPEH